MNSIMVPYIMVNGLKMAYERAKVSNCGKTVANTKVIGKTTKPMATADLFIPMETAISETGSMTKLMAEVHTSTWMAQLTAVTGKKTSNMATELRPGLMLPNTKVTTNMAKSMVSELLNGPTDLHILENSTIITFMARAFILGLIIENMKVSGEQTKCTERVRLFGRILENISENMLKIKRRAMVSSFGLMGGAIEENGLMANSTEKELI